MFNDTEEVKTCLNHCFAKKELCFFYYFNMHMHKQRKIEIFDNQNVFTSSIKVVPFSKYLCFHLGVVFGSC